MITPSQMPEYYPIPKRLVEKELDKFIRSKWNGTTSVVPMLHLMINLASNGERYLNIKSTILEVLEQYKTHWQVEIKDTIMGRQSFIHFKPK